MGQYLFPCANIYIDKQVFTSLYFFRVSIHSYQKTD